MSGTILLADDSLTIQKVVELTFADTDYRVVAVSSGDELLERLSDMDVDLVICDVIMPGKDGYEVCQQIKSSSETLHLPVILLTGTFEPFDRDRAIAAGCSEIITKPFEARKLVDTVERLIGSADASSPEPEVGATPLEDSGPAVAPEASEIAADDASDDFGTQLAPPESDDDGIEFTTSGFAEMEAAGQVTDDPTTEPEDGLDFDADREQESFEADDDAIPDPPQPDEPSARTVRIDVAGLNEQAEDAPGETEFDPTDESAAAETQLGSEPEPFHAPEVDPFEAAGTEESDTRIEDEPSMADTSPVDLPADELDDGEDAPAVGLSEEDVDRIARRVVELASDRLEQIAWEVVPDMAEIVVRQRIRELEAETEAAASEPVQ